MTRSRSNRRTHFLRVLVAVCTVLLLGSVAPGALAKTNPYSQPNETWLSLSGKVKSVSANAFVLDYGDGVIVVEMDDGDRDADGYKLVPGDEVSVYGKIDDDLFETTTIEASSVYVKKIDTFFYASAVDDEDVDYLTIAVPIGASSTVLHGTVTRIDEDEFVLNTGMRSLRVEVDEMAYNPLDDKGYQKLEIGDFVRVYGRLDKDFFEGREFEASSVTTLYR